MLKENLEIIINAYKSYQGTGMYFALYFVSVIYLFLTEKDKDKKTFFVYYPLLILVLVLNPIFCKIAMKGLESDTYVRIFWQLPMGISIAYNVTKIIKEINGKFQKIVISVCLILIIIVSGKCIYNSENYTKAESWYKVPLEAQMVTNYIINDNEDNKYALVPENIVAYIRQIDASINLYYGRRSSGGYNDIELLTALNTGDVKKVASKGKELGINYIVFKKEVILDDDMSEYGYKLFAQTYNFDLYKLEE